MSEVTRRELMPGVWLRSIHTGKFKSAYLSVTLMTPLNRETAGANALIPAVLRQGTADHPDLESLSAALDELYGGAIEPVVRKKGETQCVGFVASFLDDAYTLDGETVLEGAAALLGELLLRPYTYEGCFCPDYTRGEKENLIARIRAQRNDKRRYATHRLVEEMCREEAFGVDKLGDVAHVEAITPQSLWERYQNLLASAQIELYYCGSAQPERVEQAMRKALAGLPQARERLCPECEVALHGGAEPRYVEERLDVTQGKLAMGFRTGGITCWEEDYPALTVLNALFGGTTMSRLFLNVREKLSLCYYASSTLEKMKGLLLVSSGIEFDKYDTAREEILAQLESIRRGEIEDWELEGTRSILVNGHRSTLDDQGRLEEFWLGQSAAGLDMGIEELVEDIRRVTKEQVAAAAQKLELDTIYFLRGREG